MAFPKPMQVLCKTCGDILVSFWDTEENVLRVEPCATCVEEVTEAAAASYAEGVEEGRKSVDEDVAWDEGWEAGYTDGWNARDQNEENEVEAEDEYMPGDPDYNDYDKDADELDEEVDEEATDIGPQPIRERVHDYPDGDE